MRTFLFDVNRGANLDAIGWLMKTARMQMGQGRTEKALQLLKQGKQVALTYQAESPQEFTNAVIGELNFWLGVAALRKAEDENCVHCQDGEGCIFPIRGKGVHQQREGSTLAVEHLTETLRLRPNDLRAAWLLNIAHMTLGSHPEGVPENYRLPLASLESAEGFPRFRNIASRLGVDTLSLAGGAIADDFNGDQWLDIVVSNYHPAGPLKYFQNDGAGGFVDRTAEANLEGLLGGLNLAQADYDNDGDLDIFVFRGAWFADHGKHPNSLLQNDGSGRFLDVTYEAGLAEDHFPTGTGAWADFDNDGDLDLYIGNENQPNQLFENDGNGRFTDTARQLGVADNGYAKGVTWGDFDHDGYPDLFVSNAYQANRLYRNLAGKGFVDVASERGVDRPLNSFPTWFWDYDNDGNLDLMVHSFSEGVEFVAADNFGLNPKYDRHRLFRGDGKGGFVDVSREVGLTGVAETMGCNFGDLDNDGFLDFYLGTGYPGTEGLMPNLMYRNDRGKAFSDVSVAGGFSHLQKGHGIAFADFDHDGDQDVFVELGGAQPGDAFNNGLFENPGFGAHWIKIRLVGKRSNRFGVGAKITIQLREGEGLRAIHRWVGTGGSFGCNPLRQEIGLGTAKRIELLQVDWPVSGRRQRFENLESDQLLVIHEDADRPESVELSATPFQIAE